MSTFSQRRGFAPSDVQITIRDEAPDWLRDYVVTIAQEVHIGVSDLREMLCALLLESPDSNNWSAGNVESEIRQLLGNAEWFHVYDFIEIIAQRLERSGMGFLRQFEEKINDAFRRKGVGWQLLDGKIEIRGEESFEQSVRTAITLTAETGRSVASRELHEALQDLSKRPAPDITGAIQHGMAALECVARDVTGEPNATLGAIIKNHPGLLPKPLDQGVEKIWGYASDQARHVREGKTPDTIAIKYEDAAREAAAGRFIESRARKVIADIYTLANTEVLPDSNTRAYFQVWLNRKSLEADDGTHERYTGVVTQFLDHLGPKADTDIKKVTATNVAEFRDAIAGRLAVSTANLTLKILRSAFGAARREGLIDDNPAERVAVLKKKKKSDSDRRAFTLTELKQLLKVADAEWRGMILFGFYIGQRLGDIASITRQKLDLEREEVRLKTDKTGRLQILPLAAPLLKYIKKLRLGVDPHAPLFPRAFGIVERQGRTGNLSNQFHKILVAAGLAEKRSHHSTGKGRSASRELNDVSFHSLRHTATSQLKAAGVSDAIAREFVGHDSEEVSNSYTHIPTDILRKAARKLPDILE